MRAALRTAVEWDVIEEMPCRIKGLRVVVKDMPFYDYDEYKQLLAAAERLDHRIYVHVLLGGDAGLRAGEIRGLKWCDVDARRMRLHIKRSLWRGDEVTPKSGRARIVPMTERLKDALRLLWQTKTQSDFVLVRDDGEPLSRRVNQRWMRKVESACDFPTSGRVHILRHSFCSHLAMRGAPTKAIQELAGHAQISTTLRYMHLAPAVRDAAIRLLDDRPSTAGDIARDVGDGDWGDGIVWN